MNRERFLNINEIENGDCLNLFKEIPDNSIDVTFADPPFNLKKKEVIQERCRRILNLT